VCGCFEPRKPVKQIVDQTAFLRGHGILIQCVIVQIPAYGI